MLRDLGDKNQGLKVLRSGRVGDTIPPCNGDEIVISDIVTRLQADGYTFVRNHPVTGEQQPQLCEDLLHSLKYLIHCIRISSFSQILAQISRSQIRISGL
ncbi:hypothetical protein ColTof3_11471 [Colletotrichum tofieldiae]|nr:hypothetical protein ColTof3_11471 [Colletotrichum tofieldiae]